jgi:hypothetical protein
MFVCMLKVIFQFFADGFTSETVIMDWNTISSQNSSVVNAFGLK